MTKSGTTSPSTRDGPDAMSRHRLVYWLYPGIGLKRWAVLLAAGVLVFGAALFIGIGAVVSYQFLASVGLGVLRGRFFITGLAVGLGLTIGFILSYLGLRGVVRFAQSAPNVSLIRSQRRLANGPWVVAIGGGTGLAALLGGLKLFSSNLTAVVTVADDGGSSGLLRRDMGVLPPGDIRNCLVALADDESLLGRLFQYRFPDGGLKGHSFGNLFLAALTAVTGDFELAIAESTSVLKVRGKVLPATLEDVQLHAQLEGGEQVAGESTITAHERQPLRVWLSPESPLPLPQSLEAIARADLVVLGPGSLFTSVIPNLLIPGVREALRSTHARIVYVCNVMTQPGETDGFSAADHVEALHRHGAAGLIDAVLVNDTPVTGELAEAYALQGAGPVTVDDERLRELGVHVMHAALAAGSNVFRHDPARLSRALLRTVR
jgi:uncharacterized cofD-like protein